MTRIAVVGMACRYPDATSPRELWENALAGRRAFRRLPAERMSLDDYWDPDPATPDRFYARNAAVIEGYEFDRIAYKIAGSTYRSTDLTHWLALDMAAMALADAGFPMAEGLPRERTGVVVGNTLTGEFSRANQLRLRWPYVRRMVAAALKEQDWDDDQLTAFLDEFEATFKGPFPEVDEDTLAGGLSNTIAGRICNHFDFKGGGYTVDGALLLVPALRRHRVQDPLRRRGRRGDRRRRGPVHRPLRDHRLRQDRRAGARRDARLRPWLERLLAGRGLRHGGADARGRGPPGGAPRLRHHRGLGHLLRRQGRHHPAGGRRLPARPAPGVRPGRVRHRDRRALRGPRHRHGGRRHHRAPGAVAGPAHRRRELPAGRHQLDQGHDRAHQGGGRRRRADQGRDGGPPRGPAARPSAASTRTRSSPPSSPRCAPCARPRRGRAACPYAPA